MFSRTPTDLPWHINAKLWLFPRMKLSLHLHRQLYPANHWTLKQTEKSRDLRKTKLETFSNKCMLRKTTSKISAPYMPGCYHGSVVVFICSFKVLLIFLCLNSLYSCRPQDYFDYVINYKCNKMLFWKYRPRACYCSPKDLNNFYQCAFPPNATYQMRNLS